MIDQSTTGIVLYGAARTASRRSRADCPEGRARDSAHPPAAPEPGRANRRSNAASPGPVRRAGGRAGTRCRARWPVHKRPSAESHAARRNHCSPWRKAFSAGSEVDPSEAVRNASIRRVRPSSRSSRTVRESLSRSMRSAASRSSISAMGRCSCTSSAVTVRRAESGPARISASKHQETRARAPAQRHRGGPIGATPPAANNRRGRHAPERAGPVQVP